MALSVMIASMSAFEDAPHNEAKYYEDQQPDAHSNTVYLKALAKNPAHSITRIP